MKTFALLAVLVVFTTILPARAEEGFWPFNMVPSAEIEKKYGVQLNKAWLDKVRLASLRFNNGGSGSFVSSNGLVMTNHHVATGVLQQLSSLEKNLNKTGFHARTLAEEAKAENLELNQLVSIEDVTARVKAAVTPDMDAAKTAAARAGVIAAIEKESVEKTGLRSDVVQLYRGADYHLYRYRKFTDVRLVFAPEDEIGFFGGDPDNFTYPRFNLDVAFFRVYENGKPFETPDWFAWSKDGAKEGELTVVAGNPGYTRRLNAVSDLEFSRDFALPLHLKWMQATQKLLRDYAKKGAEQERVSNEEILGLENELKDTIGQFEGLKNPELMARKREAETALRKSADPAKAKELYEAYASIARSRESYKAYFKEFKLIEEGWGFSSELMMHAWRLVRLADERAKPDGSRLPDYNEARLPPLEAQLFTQAPVSLEFEKLKLAFSLGLLTEELGAAHPVVKIALDGKSPDARAAELVDGTKMAFADERKKIAGGGKKAIAESTDPMIRLARLVDPFARAVQTRFHRELEMSETKAYDLIAGVWKDSGGKRHYPDATFTPRICFGQIKGYEDHGKMLAPFTTLGGLFERSAQHEGKEPYSLPKNWLDKKAALNLATPFNFVSTNDIIGGNSGSPVINAKAEIVGLIFDGNIYSLVGDFYYDETTNRAVAVDSGAIVEALAKVYGAERLVKELQSRARQ